MNRRFLCFLTAAILLLLPWATTADGCEHVDSSEYVLRGYVAPDIGVPGYSGDFCCPKCGAVMIPGQSLPALEPPAGPSDGREPADSGKEEPVPAPQADPEPEKKDPEPEKKDPEPEKQPEIQPEKQPEQQDLPQPQDKPEKAPEQPEPVPAGAAEPEAPVTPEEPAKQEEVHQPEADTPQETAVQPEPAAQPADEKKPEEPVTPASPAENSPAAEPEPPARQEDPDQPAEPEQPMTPAAQTTEDVRPEDPVLPAGSGAPDDVRPEEPAHSGDPAPADSETQPVIPAQDSPGKADNPGTVPGNEKEETQEELPPVIRDEEVQAETPVETQENGAASSGGGGGSGKSSERVRFSRWYPYRRVKMNPEPGIRAEAAGTLLWPIPASPFLNLLNH